MYDINQMGNISLGYINHFFVLFFELQSPVSTCLPRTYAIAGSILVELNSPIFHNDHSNDSHQVNYSITFYIRIPFFPNDKGVAKVFKNCTVMDITGSIPLVLFVQLCVCAEHSSDQPRNKRNFRIVWLKLTDFLWALIGLGLQKTLLSLLKLTGSNILIYIVSKFVLNPDGLNSLYKFKNKHICI